MQQPLDQRLFLRVDKRFGAGAPKAPSDEGAVSEAD